MLPVLLLALLASVGPSAALSAPSDPVATIREANEAVRSALLARKGRPDFARIGTTFADYEELARRSLGKYWATQKAIDQQRVVKALRALLEEAWLPRLVGGDPMYAFAVERSAQEGDQAEVVVRTQAKGQQARIVFRLKRGKDARWRIFDATVGGLAMLEGYQEQFPQLVEIGGMPNLLQTLDAERKALAKKNAKPLLPSAAPPGG